MQELSLHILDIVQNSVRANASQITLEISEQPKTDTYTIEIIDNGSGIDAETLKQIADPFYTTRTTRKVGMGIALLKHSAEQSGGSLSIESEEGSGTKIKALFSFSHIDRPIMGDIAGTMTLLIGSYPLIRFIYNHHTALSDFEFDTKEVNSELDGMPINNPQILRFLKELINDNLALIEAKLT